VCVYTDDVRNTPGLRLPFH